MYTVFPKETHMRKLPAICLFSISAAMCFANAAPVRMELTVDGVRREAVVYYPSDATAGPRPLVFVFHGHGGSTQSAVLSFGYHTLWPEAIVVYMQGLPTPIMVTDPEGKEPGWQISPAEYGDRDIAFFDEALAAVKKTGRVDEKRVYAAGHSNGGFFTFLLWAVRGDVFAAVAASSSYATEETGRLLTPKPLMHISGKNDPLVKYALQQATTLHVLSVNGCGAGIREWKGNKLCTLYPSANGTPVAIYIHDGKHDFPPDAAPLIVAFFKEYAKP
jgi:polyhydroxybutyrate depolymerase